MFGFGDKNKVYKVTISNTGETFEVNGKINLLQAAKNAGIHVIVKLAVVAHVEQF